MSCHLPCCVLEYPCTFLPAYSSVLLPSLLCARVSYCLPPCVSVLLSTPSLCVQIVLVSIQNNLSVASVLPALIQYLQQTVETCLYTMPSHPPLPSHLPSSLVLPFPSYSPLPFSPSPLTLPSDPPISPLVLPSLILLLFLPSHDLYEPMMSLFLQLQCWEQFCPVQLDRLLMLFLAVFRNYGLFLDPYCSAIFPSLKELLLSSSYLLSAQPQGVGSSMDHWHVRELAAVSMAQLLARSHSY